MAKEAAPSGQTVVVHDGAHGRIKRLPETGTPKEHVTTEVSRLRPRPTSQQKRRKGDFNPGPSSVSGRTISVTGLWYVLARAVVVLVGGEVHDLFFWPLCRSRVFQTRGSPSPRTGGDHNGRAAMASFCQTRAAVTRSCGFPVTGERACGRARLRLGAFFSILHRGRSKGRWFFSILHQGRSKG